MVVFTCNNCGESLQKPKVDKHYAFSCRSAKFLTCVDCHKDFRGEEYVEHTKCVTEEQRYSAKGTVSNKLKKGEAKQESWTNMVKDILEKEKNMPVSQRNLLNNIAQYTNIPRKKPKFMNFINNSMGGRANMKDVECIWNIIESHKLENNTNNMQKDDTNTNEGDKKRKLSGTENDISVEVGKSKKSKKLEEKNDFFIDNSPNSEINLEQQTKFNYKENIFEILNKKGQISLKKLEKKLFNRYTKAVGESPEKEKVAKKLNKQLKKFTNIEINDGTVKLC